jgi:hypothetical protein
MVTAIFSFRHDYFIARLENKKNLNSKRNAGRLPERSTALASRNPPKARDTLALENAPVHLRNCL